MDASKEIREWSSTEGLPRGFAEWLKDVVKEQEDEKGFRSIAEELGVNPSMLSRWIGGMGPLCHNDILNLASNLGPVVYSFLGIPRPNYSETVNEEPYQT
jgi:hypothetical protein